MEIKPYENFNFDDNIVGIDEVSITYLQNSDCSGEDGKEDVQSITISTRNNACARFINIKTNSWSIDNIDELIKIIKDFERRSGLDEMVEEPINDVSKEGCSFERTEDYD